MTFHPRHLLGAGVALAILAFLGAVGWNAAAGSDASETAKTATPPPAVRIEMPTVRTIEETARYLATLEGRQDAALGFRMSGTIGAVYVEEGEAVTAGQKLAELDAPEVKARVERARMELARAGANVDHWKRELAIDERLHEKGAIPRTKLNQTQLTFTNAERQRDAAVASLREAKHMAEAHVLTAPQDGIIGRIEREAGETVMPGQSVFQLNAGPKRLRIDVLAKDQRRGLRRGSPVRIEAPDCSTQTGAVEQIETATRPPFESVRVYAPVPEDCLTDRLSGSTVPVQIVLRRTEDAMLVPLSAIDLRGKGPRVFRIDSSRTAESIPVEMGMQMGDYQQVSGVLQPNDRIVTAGASNLESGHQVHVDTAASLLNPQEAIR